MRPREKIKGVDREESGLIQEEMNRTAEVL